MLLNYNWIFDLKRLDPRSLPGLFLVIHTPKKNDGPKDILVAASKSLFLQQSVDMARDLGGLSLLHQAIAKQHGWVDRAFVRDHASAQLLVSIDVTATVESPRNYMCLADCCRVLGQG